jgi:hypothetical protein
MSATVLILIAFACGGLLAGLLLTGYRSARRARREDMIGVGAILTLEALAALFGVLTVLPLLASVVLIVAGEIGFALRSPPA